MRRLITSLRISTHNLPIEFLRKLNVERSKRICNCCNINALGTEKHVLFECLNNDLTHQRNLLYSKLSQICSQWENLNTEDKFLYLINAHDNTFNFYFAIFLEKAFRIVKMHYSIITSN